MADYTWGKAFPSQEEYVGKWQDKNIVNVDGVSTSIETVDTLARQKISDLLSEMSVSNRMDLSSMQALNNRYIRNDGTIGTSNGNIGVRFNALPDTTYTVQLSQPNESSFGIGVFGETDTALSFEKNKMADRLTIKTSPDAKYIFAYWRGDDQASITCTRSVVDEVADLKKQVKYLLDALAAYL